MDLSNRIVPQKAKLFDRLAKIVTGTYRWINNEYFPEYLLQTKQDLRLFASFMEISPFARNQSSTFHYLIDKYEQEYCPSHLAPYFSRDNEIEYAIVHAGIDILLEHKDDQHYSLEE